jgi:hypothetical protein
MEAPEDRLCSYHRSSLSKLRSSTPQRAARDRRESGATHARAMSPMTGDGRPVLHWPEMDMFLSRMLRDTRAGGNECASSLVAHASAPVHPTNTHPAPPSYALCPTPPRSSCGRYTSCKRTADHEWNSGGAVGARTTSSPTCLRNTWRIYRAADGARRLPRVQNLNRTLRAHKAAPPQRALDESLEHLNYISMRHQKRKCLNAMGEQGTRDRNEAKHGRTAKPRAERTRSSARCGLPRTRKASCTLLAPHGVLASVMIGRREPPPVSQARPARCRALPALAVPLGAREVSSAASAHMQACVPAGITSGLGGATVSGRIYVRRKGAASPKCW